MALVNIDTTNEELLKNPTYEPAPAAIYNFAIANKVLKVEKAKSSNNMMIKVELRCIDDIAYGDGKSTKGMKLTDYMVLTDEGKWKLVQLSKSCSVESADGQLDLDDFIGAECSASVIIDSYMKDEAVDGVMQPVQKFTNKIDEYVWA